MTAVDKRPDPLAALNNLRVEDHRAVNDFVVGWMAKVHPDEVAKAIADATRTFGFTST